MAEVIDKIEELCRGRNAKKIRTELEYFRDRKDMMRYSAYKRRGIPRGSPKSFAKWKAQGFDVLTYRKGKQSRWQTRFFETVTGEVEGRRVEYRLAERTVKLSNGLPVREVLRTDSVRLALTRIVAASRSRSAQRSAASSPRLSPVVAATR